MILLIIILVIYYAIGCLAAVKLNKDYKNYDNDMLYEFGYVFACIFGLGIIPILHLIIIKSYELLNDKFEQSKSKQEKEKISVYDSSNKETGIMQYRNYLAYNFPDEKYMGVIQTDIREIDYKQMNKIIEKLNKWAEIERMKHAKLNAIKEIKL